MTAYVQYDTKTVKLQVDQYRAGGGGGLTYTESMTLNVGLWPRIKINWYTSHEVMTTCNVVRVFRFRKCVSKSHRWPSYKGGQFHRFLVSYS
jgi:hypothetical protein